MEAQQQIHAMQMEISAQEYRMLLAQNGMLPASKQEPHTWRTSPAVARQEVK